MNEDRAKQIFKDGGTVTMPTGAVVDNLRAYHEEEKRFAEQKKAQKDNPAADSLPDSPAPRSAFADVPNPNRVMRSRGFGAGGPDVGDDLPGDSGYIAPTLASTVPQTAEPATEPADAVTADAEHAHE